MFENKILMGDIHMSRFIASWIRVGGSLKTGKGIDDFNEWLRSLGLSEDDIYQITNLATCGKMELESDARKFMKTIK